jgi:hypothetical protein
VAPARPALQVHVAALRRLLARGSLSARPPVVGLGFWRRAQVGVDATDPFSLTEALESSPPDFAGASDSILVATAHGAGGAVSEAVAFLLGNETNANATDDVRARAARAAARCPSAPC